MLVLKYKCVGKSFLKTDTQFNNKVILFFILNFNLFFSDTTHPNYRFSFLPPLFPRHLPFPQIDMLPVPTCFLPVKNRPPRDIN